MSIEMPDMLNHRNPLYPIVDVTDVKGGVRSIATFSSPSLISEFGNIPEKTKTNYSMLLETSTNILYYLKGSDPTNTSDWTTISRPYKVYTAILTQSGTASPTATVLENNLGFTPVWNRNSAGTYYLSSSNGFPLLKTIVFFAKNTFSGGGYDFYVNNEDTTTSDIYISTSDTGVQTDGLILRTPIEIRVYN